MVAHEGAVYCTLLLSDNYLPGAVVLAHSLRDNGSEAKLVALYTPDTLQAATIAELQTVYDELIPVYRMTNHTPANLWLMERPDLIATFTKIELWRQTQYKRIVYIDSDVVSIRAPDELLELDVDFAAAPDVGWPDCFNSGVMVLRPNMQDYFALKALAERGISFDGADQGLLNIHFRNWHRLSFTYNCTPSASYQYVPAYKHFQSTISLIHFIGSQKPWNMPRQVAPFDSPYNQLLGRWWMIYDRHYHPVIIEPIQSSSQPVTLQHYTDKSVLEIVHAQPLPESVRQQHFEETSFVPAPESKIYQHNYQQHPQQHQQPDLPVSSQPENHTRGEYTQDTTQISYPPEPSSVSLTAEQPPHHHHLQTEHHMERPVYEPVFSVVPLYVRGEEHVKAYIQQHSQREHSPHLVQTNHVQTHHIQPQDAYTHRAMESSASSEPAYSLDPSDPANLLEPAHQPDPSHFQHSQLPNPRTEIQWTPSPQPPVEESIFEAPKAEWDASREPPPLNSTPEGFALESKTYNMSEDNQLFQPPVSYPEAPKNMYYQVPDTKPEPQKLTQLFPWENSAPKPTRVFADNERQSNIQPPTSPTSTKDEESRESQSPQPTSWTSEVPSLPSESWDTYSRLNAWDEVPEIQKYIQTIQQSRKGRVQVISQTGAQPSTQSHLNSNFNLDSRNTLITTFPSAQDRPSLPVTPAPIHRAPGPGIGSPTSEFPAAEGVPNQADWVGLTVDAFLQLLRATYLYWEFTESFSPARGAAAAAE